MRCFIWRWRRRRKRERRETLQITFQEKQMITQTLKVGTNPLTITDAVHKTPGGDIDTGVTIVNFAISMAVKQGTFGVLSADGKTLDRSTGAAGDVADFAYSADVTFPDGQTLRKTNTT